MNFLISSKLQGETSDLRTQSMYGGEGMTRRRFLKRSGAASVATFLCWNMMNQNSNAYTFKFSFLGFNFEASFKDPASTSEEPAASVSGEYWMKCYEPASPDFGLINGKLDADPVGWKELTINGNKSWYRLWVQGFVRTNKIAEADFGYNYTTVGFACFGRWALMKCNGDNDKVPPPNDSSYNDGIGEWSAWQHWVRYAEVSCSRDKGEIKSYQDNATPGDTLNDGFKIWTELKDGGDAVICTLTLTHPNGGAGDPIPATVVFISEKKA